MLPEYKGSGNGERDVRFASTCTSRGRGAHEDHRASAIEHFGARTVLPSDED